MSLTKVTFSMIDGAFVNIQDYGADPTGINDSTSAIQSALNACGVTGQTLYLPSGIYKITQKLSVNNPTKNFSVIGESQDTVILKRSAATCSIVLDLEFFEGMSVENFTIDGGYAEYPTYPVSENLGHGLVVGNSSYCTIRKIKVINYRDTGIICGNASLPVGSAPIYSNNLIDQCICLGNNAANNGIMLLSVSYSGVTNCHVQDLDLAGTPSYAIQLKNACWYCYFDNCSVNNSKGGFLVGQDQGPGGHIAGLYARMTNLFAQNCIFPFYIGSTQGLSCENLICVQTSSFTSTMQNGVYIAAESYGNVIKNVKIVGLVGNASLPAARPAVYFEETNATYYPYNNDVQIDQLSVTGDKPCLARFTENAANNVVSISNCLTHNIGLPDRFVLDFNTAPNSGNAVSVYNALCQDRQTITSGVIYAKSNFVNTIIVKTEDAAATDDLDTINGGYDGQIVILSSEANARDVVVKHGTGNILLAGETDCLLGEITDNITLTYYEFASGGPKWAEVSRSINRL